MSGTTRVSRYQEGKTRKVKTNLHLLEQEIVSGSDICWAIRKSAPHPRQPHQHPTTQFFTGQMPFLPPNQQRQSTEGSEWLLRKTAKNFRGYFILPHPVQQVTVTATARRLLLLLIYDTLSQYGESEGLVPLPPKNCEIRR